MTKKEKKQLENLLWRMEQLVHACCATNALCIDEDGAYTHNAMVVSSIVTDTIWHIKKSIDDEKLLIPNNFD